MSINDVTTMSELKKVNEEIDSRTGMTMVYQKQDALKQGVKELKEQYEDVYTEQALNDLIDEYEANEYEKHIQELESYDNYSASLVSKANMLVDKLESNLQAAADPTTKYELEQHNYLVDKLKNNLVATFTGSNANMNELNSVLKQSENDKNYARALTHMHGMLLNNIENNASIEQPKKHQLREGINTKMEELKQSILPYEYKQLQNIKENLDRSASSTTSKAHRYQMLKDMENGKAYKYKIATNQVNSDNNISIEGSQSSNAYKKGEQKPTDKVKAPQYIDNDKDTPFQYLS